MNPRPANHTQVTIDAAQEVAQVTSGNVRIPLLHRDVQLILRALMTHHGHFARVMTPEEREWLAGLYQDLSVFVPRP